MAFRIPPTIKLKVLHLWLKEVSRDKLALRVGIGYGSVSRILDKIQSNEIPDLDLLRLIALKIKEEGFNLTEVASGIRLTNFFKKMGGSEEEIENLFKLMEIYCFKTDQDFHDFVTIVERVQEFETDFNISILQVPDLLEQKRQELYGLEGDIMKAKISLNQKSVETLSFS